MQTVTYIIVSLNFSCCPLSLKYLKITYLLSPCQASWHICFLYSSLLLAFLSIVPQVYPLSFISFSMVRLHVVFGLPLSLFLFSSIRLIQLILLQRRFLGRDLLGTTFFQGRHISGTTFVWADIYRGRLFFKADRSLGAKQEGLTIVHFLNKLIVSCKEAVRFPF